MEALEPLWVPTAEGLERAQISQFRELVNRRHGLSLQGYDDLYAWSVSAPARFLEDLRLFVDVRFDHPARAVHEGWSMPGTRWFPGATLNFAEHCLRWRDDRVALIGVREGTELPERLTHARLYEKVAQFRRFLEGVGVTRGDRVVGVVPNTAAAVIAMLATTSMGAIWSSCSPDFGFRGVMDRFGQIRPKVLVATNGYTYNGKRFETVDRVRQIRAEINSIEAVVSVPLLDHAPIEGSVDWSDALDNDATTIDFVSVPFDHPLYILYSSGTTGVPKCIVHGHGGTLLQHLKELVLHTDLRREDTLFYFTTCGWMMWNWLVSGLAVGSSVLLYEGSPGWPTLDRLWQVAEDCGVTVFGTSPKFLGACAKAGLTPKARHDLSRIRTVLSTGSPASVEDFHWVSDNVGNVQLASICGGTDLISCFMLGSPVSPVYAGEIQKRGLGMAVEAWTEDGKPVIGEKAELVCKEPFVSMPVGFWDDPDERKYRAAYFEHFPGVWRHGDFITLTERGGVIVHGRSDATLNPGGVRIGTSEIYRQVEAMEEIVDSLVVDQRQGADTRIVLFVVLRPGITLDDALVKRIQQRIGENTTPRHVPRVVLEVPDIPRTISGKKVELAVTRILHGEEVGNRDALANPEALEAFAALRSMLQRT